MVGVAEQNLDAKLFQHILRDALDRGQGSDRHEHRRLNVSMRSDEPAGTSQAAGSVNFKFDEHCGGF